VVEIDAGLWCLRLPLDYPRVTSVNAYLVALDEGWLLVDTGTRLELLHAALDAAQVEPGEICALLATHAHSDHSALAATLAEIHGWPLWRGPGPVTAVDALRDNAEPVAARRRRCRRAGVPECDLELMADALITGQLGTETRRPADRELGDGDRLRGRRSAWEVIMMPGHSPSQVGLWDAERRRLIGATEDWELFGSCFTHDVRTKLPGTGWREGLDEILGAVVKHHTDAEVVTAHHGHMPEIELTGEDSAR
jgi:glyoxylase-like metal-dependent hydrolase (beta-lactamase superfamily II)